MPFINVKISEKLSDTQVDNIKSRLGEAISLIPGKSEAWLMVNIQDLSLAFGEQVLCEYSG
jgi:phenylpyruvate tautomerase PptA (4-oxalocrotonate tautomerase family)